MKFPWLVLSTIAGVLILDTYAVHAQTYPSRPIRIITSDAGSGSDFAARLVAMETTGKLGQSVIVDNRPSTLDGDLVAHAAPDGYTLLVEGVSFWVAPLLQKMPYDPVKDFAPISIVTAAPWCLVVHPSVPVKSVKDLIELARSKPGEINYASAGIGGGAHLAAELFKDMTGVNIVHIPFKGTGTAVISLIGGQVQLMFANPPAVTPHIKSGKLRAIAVTSANPSALFPGLPTVAASGLPGFDVTVVTSLFAPAKTPTAIINRLNQEVAFALHRPEVKERVINTGVEAIGSSVAELANTEKSDIAKWSRVIKDAGIRLD